MYPINSNAPRAREQRQVNRVVARMTGAEDRLAEARDKRVRKNAKRLRDAFRTGVGEILGREYLEGKAYVAAPTFIGNGLL